MLKTYKGSCHCGVVRFEAEGFRLLSGEEQLTEYRFNTRKNQHFFCKRCGVRAFGVGNDTPVGKMVGVNVACLEGISEEELSKIPIAYADGMNERWDSRPEFLSHL